MNGFTVFGSWFLFFMAHSQIQKKLERVEKEKQEAERLLEALCRIEEQVATNHDSPKAMVSGSRIREACPTGTLKGAALIQEVDGERHGLITELPDAVWEEFLLSCLDVKDAVSVRGTCQHLRTCVSSFAKDVRTPFRHLEAALTCLPAARHVKVFKSTIEEDNADLPLLASWIGENAPRITHFVGSPKLGLIVLLTGVLPDLRQVQIETDDAALAEAVLNHPSLEGIVSLSVDAYSGLRPLVPLRRLTHLRELNIDLQPRGEAWNAEVEPVQVAPFFIPSTLKTLAIEGRVQFASLASALTESGSQLESLTVGHPSPGNPALPAVINACAASIKNLSIIEGRLTREATEALLSACAAWPLLQTLSMDMDGLAPDALVGHDLTLPALRTLNLNFYTPLGRPMSPIWRLMGQCRMPVLTSLHVTCHVSIMTDMNGLDYLLGSEGGDADLPAMAAALDGVKGTLRHLVLTDREQSVAEVNPEPKPIVEVRDVEALGSARQAEPARGGWPRPPSCLVPWLIGCSAGWVADPSPDVDDPDRVRSLSAWHGLGS
jgi:hypothetical protein